MRSQLRFSAHDGAFHEGTQFLHDRIVDRGLPIFTLQGVPGTLLRGACKDPVYLVAGLVPRHQSHSKSPSHDAQCQVDLLEQPRAKLVQQGFRLCRLDSS